MGNKSSPNILGWTVALGIVAIVAMLGFAIFGGAGLLGLKSAAGQPNAPPATAGSASTPSQVTASSGVCTQALSGTQSLQIAAYDADKPGTQITGISTTVFLDPSKGSLNPAGNTTQPGSTYSILITKNGYTSTLVSNLQTSCTTTSPTVGAYEENLDGAPTVNVYNVGGRTANANLIASLQALTASSPTTFGVEFNPSALYKHIGGGVPSTTSPQADAGYFNVFVNATNSSWWDPSGFYLGMNGAPGGSVWSGQCTPYNNPGSQAPANYIGAPPTYIKGTLIYGWLCHGDFSGQSTGVYHMDMTVKPSATYGGGNNSIGIYVVPVDYFQNTVTGVLQTGGSKDNGAAIQNSINASIYID